MLSLDRDYVALKPYLEAECARRKLSFDFTELNPGGWGDAMWVGANGIHNVEIKQAGEILSDIDHLINQIRNQSASSDYLWLFVYGEMEPAEDGNSYSRKTSRTRVIQTKGQDSFVEIQATRRHHRANYAGHRKILWRFREVGVQVIEVRDLPELAFELCTLYECSQNEGSTFSRLIAEKIRISETDPARAAFMRTLMGIQGAGIGEEVADAIASEYKSIRQICRGFEAEDDGSPFSISDYMAKIPLRNGKRRIGPAAVAKLKTALGL